MKWKGCCPNAENRNFKQRNCQSTGRYGAHRYYRYRDCGLPVPDGVKKIDLALKLGTPRFLEVVEELAKYMEIEKIHVAAEMQSKNEECWQQMHKLFDGKEWIVTDHEHFKQATKTAKAVIRTGETTPFANVILHSGVIF